MGIRTMTSSLFKAFLIDLERQNLNVALDRRKKKLAEAAAEYTLHAWAFFGLQACLCYTVSCKYPHEIDRHASRSLFVWLVADGWCWFVLREKYCWLVADLL
jgi:hypothetical protein